MEKIFELAQKKADQAELFFLRQRKKPVTFELANLERVHQQDTIGIALRVIKNGLLGFAGTTAVDDLEVVDRALSLAEFGEKVTYSFPGPQQALPLNLVDPTVSSIEIADLSQDAINTYQRLAGFDSAIPCDVTATAYEYDIAIKNTNGFDDSYKKTAFYSSVYTRSPQGFGEVFYTNVSGRYFKIPDLHLNRLIQQHHTSQKRVAVPTKKMKVIFTPAASGALFYRLLAGIDGNSLQTGISPLQTKLNKQIFSPALTIIEDPHRQWGLFSCPFDDEGIITEQKHIVQDGVLKSFLYDLKTAAQLKTKTTGNGFRRGLFSQGHTTPPTPQTTNLVIPQGQKSLEQLIQNVDEGLIVDSVMGAHTGNIPQGDFSLNVGSGFYIKDGQLQGKAVDAMVSGNIYDVFQKEMEFSNEISIMSMFSPLGYSPDILVEGISVTGKG